MRRTIFRITFASAITAVSLYYAFRRVDLSAVASYLVSADYVWVFLSLIVMFIGHLARSLRWRVMLHSVKRVRVINAFSAVMIGYALNQITPRGGEFLRPYILGSRENLSKSMLLATIVIERSLDVLFLLVIILTAIVIYSTRFSDTIIGLFQQAAWTRDIGINSMGGVIRVIALPILLFLALLIFMLFTRPGQRLLRVPLRMLPQRWQNKGQELLLAFKEGMRTVKSGGQISWVIIYTICIWAAYLLTLYFPFFALHLEKFNLTFGDAFILLALISIAMAIAPTPGAIGVYHFFCIQGMVLFLNVDFKTAAAFATLTHGFQYICMLLTGGAFFIAEHVTWKDVKAAEKQNI